MPCAEKHQQFIKTNNLQTKDADHNKDLILTFFEQRGLGSSSKCLFQSKSILKFSISILYAPFHQQISLNPKLGTNTSELTRVWFLMSLDSHFSVQQIKICYTPGSMLTLWIILSDPIFSCSVRLTLGNFTFNISPSSCVH